MKRVVLVLAFTACSWAQCAMCFRNAQAQDTARARAFNRGILALGAPAAAGLCGLAVLIWRRRETGGDNADGRR
jgi:hypothetical protein